MNPKENNHIGREELLERIPYGVGCEVGVNKGGFARKILNVVGVKHLYLVDPWVRDPSTEDPSCRGGSIKLPQVHKKFSDEIRGGKVTIIVGWSNVLKMFPDNSLDWIYIDGDHRYETVKQDIKQGCRVVKPDGMVMGHDSHPKMQRSYIQVRKALDDMGKEYEEIGNNYIIKGEL